MTIMIVHVDRKCLPAIRAALSQFKDLPVFYGKVKRLGENASRAILAGGGTTPMWLRLDVVTRPDDVPAIADAIKRATRGIGAVHLGSFEVTSSSPHEASPDRHAFIPQFPI